MEILVQRLQSRDGFTPGEMLINGQHFCWTLEDEVRERKGVTPVEWKVYGKTAITAGRYAVVINWSNRFKRQMTEIVNVPGFVGVRIHNGISEKSTDGCVLVHYRRAPDLRFPDYDRSAMLDLEKKILEAMIARDKVFIEISQAQQTA